MRWRQVLVVLTCFVGLLAAGLVDSPEWSSPSLSVRPVRASETSVAASVVVNEVAWEGTQSDSADEWIELYNTTDRTIDLTGWTLTAADGSPALTLVGTVSPRAYYLIERTDDATVSDIPADLACSFNYGLHNDGESLTLRDAFGQIVDTVNADGGPWPTAPEGEAPAYRSMERLSPYLPDEDGNWASNDGLTTNGLDCAGLPINGTPRAINSTFLPIIGTHADLTISKVGPSEIMLGQRATYHLSLHNAGGYTATGVILTDTLPLDLQFITQESDLYFTQTSASLIWTTPELAPGASHRITVTTLLSATEPTLDHVTNVVTASSQTPELNPADDTAAWASLVKPTGANLSVVKRGPLTIKATDRITYMIAVSNTGTTTATEVVLLDQFPEATALVTHTASFTCTTAPSALSCEIPALAADGSVTFELALQLAEPMDSPSVITNHITVTMPTPDANPHNNYDHWTTTIDTSRILIAGALFHGCQYDQRDEAVQLVNVGTMTKTLDGWQVCKFDGGSLPCWSLPTIVLGPGGSAWLARDGAAFHASFGFSPTHVLQSWPRLVDTGDEIILRAPGNEIVDTLVYGAGSTPAPGWYGPALQPYYNNLMGEPGQILARIRDEASGLPKADTDTIADWRQVTTNFAEGRQVVYPGWDLDTLSTPLSVTEPATTLVGVAPDNALGLLTRTLMAARSSITIEVYSLRHPEIIRLLAEKARDGVSVNVFLEGGPVGVAVESTDWQTQLHACQVLEAAGGACWFMIHEPEDHVYNRYKYLHAKLAVIDQTWAVVGSQNFTWRGLPGDPKGNGTQGTRGVMVVTDAPSVVRRASQILAADLDPRNHKDVLRWNTRYTDKYGVPIPALIDLSEPDGISYTVRFSEPFVLSGTFGFELFTAPDAALRQSDALLGLLSRAGDGHEIYVEQLYELNAWGTDPITDPNLRLEAYIAAARRGAKVRILVNGRSYVEGYDGPAAEGIATAAYVNQLAREERLDLRAAVGDPTGDGIHNKMVLVDLGAGEQYAHVGSLNGSEASSKVNREVILQIRADDVYNYLLQVFQLDWHLSNPLYLPLVFRRYTPPPPPADYVVISEVAYSGSAAYEWIELHNPTGKAIDLSTFKLGDAESPQVYEPMFQFPPGTTIAPGSILVIAVNASEVPAADLEFYESSAAVPNMVPYPAWGSQDYPMALRNEGDQVILLDANDHVVDAVVWGDKHFPGTVPHPGVVVIGASLERYPAAQDTNDCASDFRERYPPTPGVIPTAP
ncbi:MAG: lamin tail domain-containing protein [Anaerolineae bacterium]